LGVVRYKKNWFLIFVRLCYLRVLGQTYVIVVNPKSLVLKVLPSNVISSGEPEDKIQMVRDFFSDLLCFDF